MLVASAVRQIYLGVRRSAFVLVLVLERGGLQKKACQQLEALSRFRPSTVFRSSLLSRDS
jgi:hypothetical protein